VSANSFYAWLDRPPSEREKEEKRLELDIYLDILQPTAYTGQTEILITCSLCPEILCRFTGSMNALVSTFDIPPHISSAKAEVDYLALLLNGDTSQHAILVISSHIYYLHQDQ
jgi:hypothetical protein